MALEPDREGSKRDTPVRPKLTQPAEDFDQWPHAVAPSAKPQHIDQEGYDPRPHEDQARRNIAYWLIGLLTLICLATFMTLWFTRIPVEDVMKIVQILLGPVIALVSAATGFYYGTKSKN